MLYIMLQEDEKLHIGNEVTLQFVRKCDDIARLCGNPGSDTQITVLIDAPIEVTIVREEITTNRPTYRKWQRRQALRTTEGVAKVSQT